jgi:hypothetical protein
MTAKAPNILIAMADQMAPAFLLIQGLVRAPNIGRSQDELLRGSDGGSARPAAAATLASRGAYLALRDRC